MESLVGSIITCADKDDILPPKPKVCLYNSYRDSDLSMLFQQSIKSNKKGNNKGKGKAKKATIEPKVHTPESLNLSPIARRQDVLNYCNQDITHLEDVDTGAIV